MLFYCINYYNDHYIIGNVNDYNYIYNDYNVNNNDNNVYDYY